LRQGRLVAFPTERFTVWALTLPILMRFGVFSWPRAGLPDHPLIVHIPSIDGLNDWALTVPEAAQQLAARFWPGPLALILNKKPEVRW